MSLLLPSTARCTSWCVLWIAASSLAAACGDPDCPDGTSFDGVRCIFTDAGVDGAAGADASTDASDTSDATTSDALATDGDEPAADASCGDTETDPNNCGECGRICGGGLACVGGACVDSLVAVAASNVHSCGQRSSGTVVCWGENALGQLGTGTTTDSAVPVVVAGVAAAQNLDVSNSDEFSCAVERTGSVVCWGQNDRGMLGRPTPEVSNEPTAVPGVTDAVLAAAGGWHACAVRSGRTVVCWGTNDSGQLGNGTTSDLSTTFTATAVPGLTDIVALSAGGSHNCSIDDTGLVMCWGQNYRGQVGVTSGPTVASPSAVPSIDDAIQVDLGAAFSCALRSTGVWCWGDNQFGQLGSGSTPIQRIAAELVAGTAGAVHVSAGGNHACAVLGDATVTCWGANNFGQLGDGTTTNRPSPVAVIGLAEPATHVVAGGRHTCVALESGGVACWGENMSGQLGTGAASAMELTPTAVVGLP